MQPWEELKNLPNFKEILTDLYHNQGLSMLNISFKLGISEKVLQETMKKLGIESRGRARRVHPWRRARWDNKK